MLARTVAPSVEPVSLAEARLHLREDDDITDEDALITMLITAAREYAESYTGRSFVTQKWRLTLDAFPNAGQFESFYGACRNAVSLERGNVLSVDAISYFGMDGAWATMPSANYVADLSGCPARVTPVFGQIWPIPMPQIASVRVDYTAGYASGITADATADTITPALWPTLAVNDPVMLSNSGGVLPAPLVPGATYYVQSIPSAGVYKLSATIGGSAIDITDTGSGASFIGEVPRGIRQWILMRVNTLFENREAVAILNRGKVELLPFVDALLDPFNVVLA